MCFESCTSVAQYPISCNVPQLLTQLGDGNRRFLKTKNTTPQWLWLDCISTFHLHLNLSSDYFTFHLRRTFLIQVCLQRYQESSFHINSHFLPLIFPFSPVICFSYWIHSDLLKIRAQKLWFCLWLSNTSSQACRRLFNFFSFEGTLQTTHGSLATLTPRVTAEVIRLLTSYK